MKDSRTLGETDLKLVASYFGLTISHASHFHLAREMEYDMNMKIKELLK